MCGILSLIMKNEEGNINLNNLNKLIMNRGPDNFNLIKINKLISFYGAVLHLRGNSIISQPLCDSNNNILLWNGEIYDGITV